MNAIRTSHKSISKTPKSILKNRLANELNIIRDKDELSPENSDLGLCLPDYEESWLREMLYFDRF